MSDDRRQLLGALGERLAAEHLERRGFQIVERNFRTRRGELDIVAFNGEVLAFVEVKSRKVGRDGGNPFEAIHARKRSQVRKMAGQWLMQRRERPYAETLRFDAVAVTFDLAGRLLAIDHLEGAF